MKTYEEKLRKWVNDQSADRKFDFDNIHNCLLCHFFRETEMLEVQAGGDGVRIRGELDQFWNFGKDWELRGAICEGCEDITKLRSVLERRAQRNIQT